MAESFLIKLPNAPNKCNLEYVFQYYSKFITEKPFHLSGNSEEEVFNIIQYIVVLKDGAEILAKLLREICNLSITSKLFQLVVKLQSSNLFLRKAKKLNHLTTDLILRYQIISKVLETVIHDQTNTILKENSLL